jgi:apolipoprotein N-acyltransferase
MKRNNLGYLGLLGLLGLAAFPTNNYWILGMFGYFGLLTLLQKSSNDERTDQNINRAARNAFAFYAITVTIFTIYFLSANTFDAIPIFEGIFPQGMTVFGLSYMQYDKEA